jgi:hypothetical protein
MWKAALAEQTQANGLSLEAFATEVLRERSRVKPCPPPLTRSQIAGRRIRELRKGVTVGNVSIKTLIEEGRE